MENRINYIDRMKGFTILIVVLAHVYLMTFDMGDSLVFRFCASFEMPLFMFVSGFVAYLPSKVGGAINKKLTRRLVSYICPAFVVSYVLALYSFLILGNREMDIEETLIGGLWYLKALAIFVCIQAVLVKCKNVMLEWIIIAIAECMFLVGWKLSLLLHELFCLEHCFFFYPFFMMGYYFRRYNLMKVVKSKNWLFTISLVGFICLLNANIEIHALRFLSERIVRPTFAILAISYLFAVRENKNTQIEGWLNRIGTRTLDIYMYHSFFLSGSFVIFDLQGLKNYEMINSNPIIYLILAMLVTFFLSYVSIAIGYLVRKSDFLGKNVYGIFFIKDLVKNIGNTDACKM